MTAILTNNHAPANEARIAGMPNFIETVLSVFFQRRLSLKRLLVKCTKPVNAIAISTGKKKAKTGVRIVPSPKPEKNVSIAVTNATKQMIIISM